MSTVIVYHDVKDVNHWLASPRRKEVFEPVGVTNIRTFGLLPIRVDGANEIDEGPLSFPRRPVELPLFNRTVGY